MADLMQQVRKTLDSVKMPPLIGPLADLPDHVKQVVEAYGRACVREAISAAMRAAPEGCIPERAMLALATGWRRNASVSVGGSTVLIQCAESLEAAVIAARPQGVKDD